MDWRKRLHEHEESPPPAAWEAIREEVSSHPAALGRRLEAMEEQPPAEAWDRIAKSIGEAADDRRKVPVEAAGVRSLPSRAFAYAAAIAGIGLFVSSLYWFQSGRRNEGVVLGAGNALSAKAEVGSAAAPSASPDGAPAAAADESAPDSVSPLRYTRVGKSSRPGRIELCDDKGNCVAVSSKMREMAESMGPSLNASAVKAVNARKWNRTIRRWQRRLQNSDYLPNPGNLFDIGQLAELLTEAPRP